MRQASLTLSNSTPVVQKNHARGDAATRHGRDTADLASMKMCSPLEGACCCERESAASCATTQQHHWALHAGARLEDWEKVVVVSGTMGRCKRAGRIPNRGCLVCEGSPCTVLAGSKVCLKAKASSVKAMASR
jgi:hypothetical protein